jgi:anti-sigma B factor antagonist
VQSVKEGNPGVGVSMSADHDGSVLTVAVSGDVDMSTSPEVERAIREAVASPAVTTVRVDLRAVDFLDSSGIAALLKGRRSADERGLAYRVIGARGIARRVLEISGAWVHLCGEETTADQPGNDDADRGHAPGE